jgi:hypothetical protein
VGVKLTPEDLARLQTKEVANAIRKLQSGKTLTSGERALLAQASVGGDLTAAGGYASTWEELGQRLGVTRRAIQEWRKDPRYLADCPPDRADGRHDVAAWAAFMVRHSLKRADEHLASGRLDENEEEIAGIVQPPKIGGSQHEWKTANLALTHRQKENEVLVMEGTLLVASELEVPLGATFAVIQTKLAQFPARVARYLRGLTDIGEIEEKLRDELDADLGDLQAARYTAENAIAEAVAAVPFDDATKALCEKLLFAGSDRTALLELACAIATEAVRRLGQKALPTARLESPAAADRPSADTAAAAVPPAGEVTPESKASRPQSPSRSEERGSSGEKPASESPGASRSAPRRPKAATKKARREPIPAPPEVEARTVATPRKLTRRRKR